MRSTHELVMIEIRYKLAAFLKDLVANPSNLLCLVVYAFALIFVVTLLVDAFIQKRKFDRLKKPYQRGRG